MENREQAAEALELLSMLFQSFPSSVDKSSPTMAKAYLLAIDGCSLAALQAAVHRFIRGEVEDHNGKFAPTTAELARASRYEDFRIQAEANHAARMLAKPEPQPEPQFTEEEMERRRAQVDELLCRTRLNRMPTRDAA